MSDWIPVICQLIVLIGVIITAACALRGQKVIANQQREDMKSRNAELLAEMEKTNELANQRLEAKIDRYSEVTDEKIERLREELRDNTRLARDVPILKEQMTGVLHRLDAVEKKLDK